MELCSMLWASLDGRSVWGRTETCICMAESLCCSSETTTTLLIGYTPIQNVFGVLKKKTKAETHSYNNPKCYTAPYNWKGDPNSHRSQMQNWIKPLCMNSVPRWFAPEVPGPQAGHLGVNSLPAPTKWPIESCCCSVVQCCLNVCNPEDYSKPGFPIFPIIRVFSSKSALRIRKPNKINYPKTLNKCSHSLLNVRLASSLLTSSVPDSLLQNISANFKLWEWKCYMEF